MATEIALARHWGRILVVPHGLASEAQSQYSALLVVAILCWLTLTAFTDTYRPHRTERFNFLARALTRTLLIWALITITAVFSLKFEFVSRQFIAYFVAASAFFIFVRQLGTTILLRNLRRSAHRWRTAVVIGDDEASCEHFAALLTATHPMGYQEVVVQTTGRAVNHNGNDHSNGRGAESGYKFNAESVAQFDDVYLIGVNDGADSPAGAEGVLVLLKKGKSVHIIPSLLDTRLFRQSLGDVAGIPVLSVSKGELTPIQSAVKRTVDFAVSAILLVVLSPLIGAVALAVRWTSPDRCCSSKSASASTANRSPSISSARCGPTRSTS